MHRVILALLACFSFLFAQENFEVKNTQIWDVQRVMNIESYQNFGALWTKLQGEYIASAVLIILIAVISAFALHYMVIGPKKFSHDGKKIYAFSVFERLFHFVAAISWIILVPTGLIMIFGSYFGGGFFVRLCKNLHGIATILFIISIIPMFLCWIKRMLPASYDLKWMMIVGGYLSKEKKPVPAGKFNFGQKSWYYIAVFGGFLMITTGAFMFFLDFNSTSLQSVFGISHIDILRVSAIIHNILGILCAVFFAIHIYMAVFAIKGSIHSMINGYKEEEEVYILHHYWYKELSEKKQINPTFTCELKAKK
ncbi:formate dehydrogenase N, cytochrome b-556 subunit [Campylobacter subantarcticus LMG 24377]|uniref:Formate dehydrogenase subunit gamma n=1 Tax=Campylobacter subantarcticus TaxID=497724 RepID=A0ABW9N3B5_9BACT|nr:formate dehydrogenase subunit gamma [Campylobacter subantarcticus]AJC91929.1 formate dehydrogenase N, cytochrome b-556 subunit [Campylobacter subantarcticus LMG 24377]EAL3939410.1 formate dehydrogenase subunit gamma [Campylobacter lari]MPB98769.1 formate dehydrogenase subunit gamma [Campylobacter subantarcticus]